MLYVGYPILLGVTVLMLAQPDSRAETERIPAAAIREIPCVSLVQSAWKPREVLVWKALCQGKVAYLSALSPKDPSLDSTFLVDILTLPPLQAALPHQGVRIAGARITGDVDLANAQIEQRLLIAFSTFDGLVNFTHAELKNSLSLRHCTFDESLVLKSVTARKTIDLSNSRIARLYLHDSRVEQSFYVADAEVGTIDLQSAKFGNDFYANRSIFSGEFSANGSSFANQVNMDDAEFKGPVKLDSTRIGLNLFMRRIKADKGIALNRAEIKGNVEAARMFSKGFFNMTGVRIGGELRLEDSRAQGLSLIGATIEETVTLNRSHIDSVAGQALRKRFAAEGVDPDIAVNLDKAHIGSSVFFDSGDYAGRVNLTSATIGGQLSLKGAQTADCLVASNMMVEAGAIFDGGMFEKGVWLLSSKIKRTLSFEAATVGALLKLDLVSVGEAANFSGLEVKAATHARDCGYSGDDESGLLMRAAKTGDQLNLVRAVIDGPVIFDATSVAGGFFLSRGVQVKGPVTLHFSKIGRNLEIGGGSFTRIDLTGTVVRGEFRLGTEELQAPKWSKREKGSECQPILSLRNVAAGSVQSLPGAWPAQLDLVGFSYDRLGGLDSDKSGISPEEKVEQFVDWLEKQCPFVQQPYLQLAKVLRDSGETEMAEAILYEGKERERQETSDLFKRSFLFLRLIFFGHGHYSEIALLWIGGLLLMGALVARATPEARRHGIKYGIAYSFDMLLPFIQLRALHYDSIDLAGWPRYYFYFHRLMGYGLLAVAIPDLVEAIR